MPSVVTATYGTFTDSIMIFSADTTIIYTDESGDTTGHGARKSLHSAYVNTIGQHSINIYPNPSLGNYTICNTHADVIIYDMTGRIVKQYYVNGTHNDTLNTGIYIIRINDASYKLIIR